MKEDIPLFSELYKKFNFNFRSLENTYMKYFIAYNNDGSVTVVNKETDEIVVDLITIEKMKFAKTWILATIYKRKDAVSLNEEIIFSDDIDIAFSEDLEIVYNLIIDSIYLQIEKDIYIDPRNIIKYLNMNKCDFPDYQNIVNFMFSETRFECALNSWIDMSIKGIIPTNYKVGNHLY